MSTQLAVGDPGALGAAAGALAAGRLVVIPTDTVYGLAARCDRPRALAALFAAKQRPRSLTLPVLVADTDQAATIGELSGEVRRLTATFWPGPLTVVVPRRAGFVADLGENRATVGLRMPDDPHILALLAVSGPLATTSANRSGEATPDTVSGVRLVFGDAVEVYLDGGPAASTGGSTVVALAGSRVQVLRPGPIPGEQLLAALAAGADGS